MAIKAIIFDCFGVLIMPGKDSLHHDYPQLQTQLHDLRLQSDYGYISHQDFNNTVSDLTGLPVSDLQSRYWTKNARNESAFAWAAQLKQSGSYAVGLLSNVGRGWLDEFIPSDERTGLFDVEVLSSELGIVKPAVEIFELTAERLGVLPEACVMIDDLLQNIEGAKRAGMQTILFGSTTQAQADLAQLIDLNNA